MMRTHTCGELREEHAGQTATLAGWVETIRVSGKIGFLIIRDRYGTTQCFLNPKLTEQLKDVRRESVVRVTGEVKERPDNQKKPDEDTGGIELSLKEAEVLSAAEPMPLELDESIETSEEIRMKYRYLDLRKPRMQKNIMLRHNVITAIRAALNEESFVEVETPILAKSTPEGARDYLVPSRVNPGNFFALPQSPQLFKQLLQIAGHDRYYQIARCFRDEDLRADRQPEFTQLDMEMSFVEPEDIYSTIERVMKRVWKDVKDEELKTPFPRMTYKEAMEKHGNDRPDMRNEWGVEYAFLWVVDFPMFEKSDDGKVTYVHHPFTMPVGTPEQIAKEPLTLNAKAYDLVLNGSEIGGGSIRIHRRDIQQAVFEALGLKEEDIEQKFGFFLSALQYGTPPHGGIALGMDRFCAMIAGEASIREVIAFPKTKDAEDLMLDAPSSVREDQLTDLGIRLK